MRSFTRRDFLALAGAFVGAGAAVGGTGFLWRRLAVLPGGLDAGRSRGVAAICKDAWDARPVGSGFVRHTIERLTVHHTAALLTSNTEAPRFARRHQLHHQQAGWPDLAYHYLVDGRGHVYEGRPVEFRGDTFTSYDPTGHFLVSCQGDFTRQAVPEPQLTTLVDVLAWAAGEFAVSPDTIRGHKDYAATACPGTALYPLIRDGDLARMVRERLAAGGVRLEPFCGPEADALVAAIEAGTDPIGAVPPRGRFYLRHTNTPGPADEDFTFGRPGWVPLSGRFEEAP